jgi:hypothetical protein
MRSLRALTDVFDLIGCSRVKFLAILNHGVQGVNSCQWTNVQNKTFVNLCTSDPAVYGEDVGHGG